MTGHFKADVLTPGKINVLPSDLRKLEIMLLSLTAAEK
jgi:hypothetical protein